LRVCIHDAVRKLVYNANGSIVKEKFQMGDMVLPNGTLQSFYFVEGHQHHAGVFKGTTILEEHGFKDASKLQVECKNFKCVPPAIDCCCHRVLFNEPNFAHVDTILEETCSVHGFQVIFLLKFHCELNFIEQCWGYAKRLYRLNPESSREDHLERNALTALDAVPLDSIFSFANHSRLFIDAYDKGLNGQQAVWAATQRK
ncbi:hypothetical protein L208DRAFT_1025867, partial [Tricholoma matsutake]